MNRAHVPGTMDGYGGRDGEHGANGGGAVINTAVGGDGDVQTSLFVNILVYQHRNRRYALTVTHSTRVQDDEMSVA